MKGKKERYWKEVKKKLLTGRKKETGKKKTGRNKGRWKFEGPSDWQSSKLPLDLPAGPDFKRELLLGTGGSAAPWCVLSRPVPPASQQGQQKLF